MVARLGGAVIDREAKPIVAASLRLCGTQQDIGLMERAAVEIAEGISWAPRDLGDFEGTRWNCWQRFVMKRVAGITWIEFKDEVVERNPVLMQDGLAFRPGRTYLLPKTAASVSTLWSRRLTDFAGSRWDCWEQTTQGRVPNLTWDAFKVEVVERNPSLRETGFAFLADQTYKLPEMILRPPAVSWTRRLKGFDGNRWGCWESEVRDIVEGISWADFKDQIVRLNPHLAQDGYELIASKGYWLPENGPRPRYYLTATTDDEGTFLIDGLAAGEYQLAVDAPQHLSHVEMVTVPAQAELRIALIPEKEGMVSDWEGYTDAPEPVRALIDQALRMLGDDPTVFDALEPEMRELTWGRYFVDDPSHPHHKDIVCADLVTICLAAAGIPYAGWDVVDPTGIGYTTTHAANYFRPRADHPHLIEVDGAEPWIPGDIIIYGEGDLEVDRVHHVDLFVGLFHGVDLSGNVHAAEKSLNVVNASIDYWSHGQEIGTAIKAFQLDECSTRRFGFRWCKRMRPKPFRELTSVGPA